MFLLNWQEIVQRNLSDFSDRELWHLHDLSAVPAKDSNIPTLTLNDLDFSALTNLYHQRDPYIPGKLPDNLTRLCFQSDCTNSKALFYFKRLDNHLNWYVIDIFQKGRYQCTFLALDSEPFPELRITSAPYYIPVCILLGKRETVDSEQAHQAFLFAHYLFDHQTARTQ